jgi:hypothetical protein
MTKKLEELFDLPPADVENMTQAELKESMKELDTFDDKMKSVIDLTSSDKEMDDIAEKAMNTFQDLMDLGMNVPVNAAAPIFEAATKLMGHALVAKSNKIEKKLKLLDLELKKRRLDHQIAQDTGNNDPAKGDYEGDARVLDRNELLKLIKGSNQ